jgi:hypothetical protein
MIVRVFRARVTWERRTRSAPQASDYESSKPAERFIVATSASSFVLARRMAS